MSVRVCVPVFSAVRIKSTSIRKLDFFKCVYVTAKAVTVVCMCVACLSSFFSQKENQIKISPQTFNEQRPNNNILVCTN